MAFAVNVVAVTLFVTLTAMVVSLSVVNIALVEVFHLPCTKDRSTITTQSSDRGYLEF